MKAAQYNSIALAGVEKAFRCLAAEQREVLLLVAVKQMSYEATAAVLSVPIDTVMSRLARARGSLRQLMHGPPRGMTVGGHGTKDGTVRPQAPACEREEASVPVTGCERSSNWALAASAPE